ncbi:MAG: gliding motility-associated C-terminal domain-containing protein [Bacteroidetes bacterium]|nr:gliding motility-associated C-terminal domain-containing protein [Bacteroidota bacterium]
MNYRMRIVFLLLLVLAGIGSTRAAHLIGGEITYTCQGNNLYTISLRVYRDCGGGGAAFDANANIAIYDINNQLITTLAPARGQIISLNNTLTSDPCVTVPANLCVEYADYEETVSLPPVVGGYTIVHQRCCRNSIIGNVSNPGNYGNTYSIAIPSMDTTCNSAPQILNPPDNVLCLNRPATIDLQVSEADGDSLSYDICQIFAGGGSSGAGGGGNCFAVVPNPPCPPPFTPIPFSAPYTFSNPIPASVNFTINPRTGRIRGTANQAGVYVAGICITEWRNGQILSTVRLDYQFAVTNCTQNVISDMKTPIEDPTILCDGLTVQFESETSNANSLLWKFGDPSTSADTSSATNPTWTFPRPGTYFVELIANPGQTCSDTTFAPFEVIAPVQADFLWDGVPCFEVQNIRFQATGSNIRPNTRYEWDFGADALIPSVQGPNAFGISWTQSGPKPVKLTLYWDSCSQEVVDTINIVRGNVFAFAGNDTAIQRGQDLRLNANFGADYYWSASSPIELDNPFARSPSLRFRREDDTVQVFLELTDQYGCKGWDSLWVYISDDLDAAVYNIITPNGDGVNDYFDLKYINPSSNCALTIINRWGAEVYRDQSYNNDWFGTDQDGNTLPDGTYYYILQCGIEVRSTGPITINSFYD